ncbi:MAG TPA: hypothetical protein VMW57_08765 [Methyloceanibacter sp.]|nr:hypothetical protein [Methyloceanibacter sp.]
MCVALGLSACGRSGGSASVASEESVGTVPAYNTTRMSIATAKPVDAYVLLGGKIKTCWFNPSDPLFPEHVYRADVKPDGGKVKITIHDRRNLGRAGKSAYAIDFVQEGARTVVTTQNRTMTPEQAAKMQFDIDRWKAGQTNCSKEWPKVAAKPAAQ